MASSTRRTGPAWSGPSRWRSPCAAARQARLVADEANQTTPIATLAAITTSGTRASYQPARDAASTGPRIQIVSCAVESSE